jgi:hypothetical protein
MAPLGIGALDWASIKTRIPRRCIVDEHDPRGVKNFGAINEMKVIPRHNGQWPDASEGSAAFGPMSFNARLLVSRTPHSHHHRLGTAVGIGD